MFCFYFKQYLDFLFIDHGVRAVALIRDRTADESRAKGGQNNVLNNVHARYLASLYALCTAARKQKGENSGIHKRGRCKKRLSQKEEKKKKASRSVGGGGEKTFKVGHKPFKLLVRFVIFKYIENPFWLYTLYPNTAQSYKYHGIENTKKKRREKKKNEAMNTRPPSTLVPSADAEERRVKKKRGLDEKR